ncbi:TonB-dependent receptor [Cochleicola gelatinilyticus]|uniref:TonB-dependent receptor n=1 Tax=Cochleicola gelatinilyticus TaxID=1763537 RepID=A0A167HM10_9FLAO|nr:TonB-dependent receptor [Cochleicola gelatinilyticus]OAB78755.1 TonB-dependent receptor [Cochleicola gelatinilyticus]
MLKNYFFLLFLLIANFAVFSQEDPKVSIRPGTTEVLEVINQIENQTSFKFYYVAEWFEDQKVNDVYTNVAISELLESLFNETLINYYQLTDNKIVLTRNNYIYDTLPQGFYPETTTKDSVIPKSSTIVAPVFYKEQTTRQQQNVETVRIGKEDRTTSNKQFTVAGRITDFNSGSPLANVALVVIGKNIGGVTNEDGYYELELPTGANLIEARLLGLSTVRKRVLLYNSGILNFKMSESLESLGEVYLEANSNKNVKEVIAGAEVIDVEEIKNIPLVLGERDILKVATTLPGITTAGEGAAGYNVRGGKTDQNLILLDDAVIYNPAHFFGIFSGINPFTSGSVNIFKGNIPAEYGGRLSSVFDIKTKDANTEKIAVEASVGPVTSNVVVELPVIKEKSGVLVGARTTYSNWILRSLDEPELQNSKASFFDGIAKYNHKFDDKNTIKASGYFSRDAFSLTSDSVYSYTNRLLSLRWDHTFNEKNKASFILANSRYQFNIEYDDNAVDDFKINYSNTETEFKAKLQYLMNDVHKFDYGLSAKLYTIRPGEIQPLGNESIITPIEIPQEKAMEGALFFSDEYTVNEKLLVNAGLRYSFYAALGEGVQRIYNSNTPKSTATLQEVEQFGSNEIIKTYGGAEARISARYLLRPDLSLKASYSNTLQYIHTLSTNTTVSPTDTYKLSDKNIEPQRANQYSLGLFKNLEDNTYEISVEGYFKRSKNILDYKVGAELLLNEQLETEVLQGDGRSYGVEFLVRKTKGKLNGWLGYSYSKSLIKLDGNFLEEKVNNGEYFPANYDKPHDVSIVANYKLTKRFSLSANFVYQTGRPVTFPVGTYELGGADYVLYSDRNAFRIPDYYRLDLSLNIEGDHRLQKLAHSFWNISVYNVLGRNNPYSVYFVTEGGEIKAFQNSIFSIPVPTITYNFKF